MKIICIDDSHKPESISSKHWVVKGEEYTPVKIVTSKLTRIPFFVLEEIKPDDPYYGGYRINRFGITQKQLDEAIEKGEVVVEELIEAV